jgi:hypothetical protein
MSRRTVNILGCIEDIVALLRSDIDGATFFMDLSNFS